MAHHARHDMSIARENTESQFSSRVRASGLSVRAKNVLLSNVGTMADFVRLTREQIAHFCNCGLLTVTEILEYQDAVRRKFDMIANTPAYSEDHDEPSPESEPEEWMTEIPDDAETWSEFICTAGLSVRTTNILNANVQSLASFLKLSEKELAHFRNCGQKSLKEILTFRRELGRMYRLPLDIGQKRDSLAEQQPVLNLAELDKRYDIFGAIRDVLSERARKALPALHADDLEIFMSLTPDSIRYVRNAGRKTKKELAAYQEVVKGLISGIGNDTLEDFDLRDFYIALEKTQRETRGMKSVNVLQFDLDSPYPSLLRWITEVSQHFGNTDKVKTAFLLRRGMDGQRPSTLEETGLRIDVTRERVRQILARIEAKARLPIHAEKLFPLIERIAGLTMENGGLSSKDTLISSVFHKGPQGEMLRYAHPFIDFLSMLSPWERAGLGPVEGDFVSTVHVRRVVDKLWILFLTLAQQNADEVVGQDLLSIEIVKLKCLLVARYNDDAPREEPISALSDEIVADLVSQHHGTVIAQSGRLYSLDLWNLRFGKISAFVETTLRRSKQSLHFSEMWLSLQSRRFDSL